MIFKGFKSLCAVALSAALASCAGPAPTTEDVAGTWVNENGAAIVFRPEGTVELREFPPEWVPVGGSSEPVSLEGTWELSEDPDTSPLRSMRHWWEISVDVSEKQSSQRYATSVMYTEDGGQPYVFLWEDEPDSKRISFYRRPPTQ